MGVYDTIVDDRGSAITPTNVGIVLGVRALVMTATIVNLVLLVLNRAKRTVLKVGLGLGAYRVKLLITRTNQATIVAKNALGANVQTAREVLPALITLMIMNMIMRD